MGASSQLPDAPGDTDPAASPFEQHGTNGANGTNGATTFNGSTAAPHQPDTSPPLPPKLSTLASKGSILRKASHTSFSMPKEDVDYPDFPEFDLTSAEIGDLEELLHSTDESVGALNAGAPTNPWLEIVLQLEALPRTMVKLIYNSLKLAIFISVVSLILLFVAKQIDPNFGFYDHWFTWIQASFAFVCMVASMFIWGVFTRRLILVRRMRLTWSTRRHRLCFENFIQVTAVMITNMFWFAPNVFLIATECEWFSITLSWFAFVRWTMLFVNLSAFIIRAADLNVATQHQKDGKKKEALLLDNRYLLYFVFGLLWAIPSAFVLLRVVLGTVHDGNIVGVRQADYNYDGDLDLYQTYVLEDVDFSNLNITCNDLVYDCTQNNYSPWTLIVITAFIPIYFLIYVSLVTRAYLYLRKRPFASHRMANMLEMLTWRQQLITFVVLLLSQILLGWIGHGDCATRMITWASGLFPTNLLLNGTILLPAILFMPIIPSETTVAAYRRQLKLGAYLWTERSKPDTTLPRMGSRMYIGIGEAFNDTFCVETAVKCLYYNWCVYLHAEDPEEGTSWGPMDIVTAMSLYGLTNYDVVHEHRTSSKCLIAWGRKHVVLAFRGTVDMTGCFQNLKIWYAVHEPRRKVHRREAYLSRVPMCHKGFYMSWHQGGFGQRVLDRLHQVMEECGGPQHVHITITGHSLGAAMAMLCAWDIHNTFGPCKHIECYTFGAPHVGNMAFKSDFEHRVPDCHNIINDQDAVVRSGKIATVFVRLLERPGHKILVNKRGEMLVQPSPMEAYMQLVWGFASWEDHLLSSYDEVMTNVLRAQFTHFGLKHGLAGVLGVFQNSSLRRYYAAKGLDVYQEVQRHKDGNHLTAMPPRMHDRLAGKLHDAFSQVGSAISQSRQSALSQSRHTPGKSGSGKGARPDAVEETHASDGEEDTPPPHLERKLH